MSENCALGNARRAAGILQKGDIAAGQIDGFQRRVARLFQHALVADRLRKRIRRNELLDLAHHEIDDVTLEAQEIAHRGNDHMLHIGFRQRLLDHMGEVFQDEQRFRAGILQLVFEFTRGIQRIDIHDR